MDSVFSRRLRALDHFDPEGFDVKDDKRFRNLVVWLEDQKIRHYTIEARAGLRRKDGTVEEWDRSWEKYLVDLGCDMDRSRTKEARLTWLLGHAVKTQYLLKAHELENLDVAGDRRSAPSEEEGEDLKPLGIDVTSPDFKRLVTELAGSLRIQVHPDPLVALQSCCVLIAKLSDQKTKGEKEKISEKGQGVDLSQHPMGVPPDLAESNPGLCKALKILRLLQIQDLREIQDEINSAIESIQQITACPKTNVNLGKVGR